jgi:hypothetical protein
MDCFNHRENALATLTVIVGGGFALTFYKKFVEILQFAITVNNIKLKEKILTDNN